MTRKRPRVKHSLSFHERVARMADIALQRAHHLPPGQERDALLRKARQAENVLQLDQMLSQPARGPSRPDE